MVAHQENGWRLSDTLSHFEETIQIAKAVGDRRAEGKYIGNLGTLYESLGQPETAIELYTKSIEIAIEIGDKRSESIHLSNLACVSRLLGKYESAIAAFEKASMKSADYFVTNVNWKSRSAHLRH